MSQEIRFEDFMSDSDASIWIGERDPRLRSTMLCIWVLDRMPDEDGFEDSLAEAVEAIPRLRQRVVQDPYAIASPRWEVDPFFDPHFHLRKLHLGGEGSLRDLLDLAEPIAMQAFDKDRPLWELSLVEGLEGGRAGVIMKLHHAVSDGVGLVNMLASLVDTDRGAGGERGKARRSLRDMPTRGRTRKDEKKTQSELVREAIAHRVEVGWTRTRRFWSGTTGLLTNLVTKPGETVERARAMVASIGRLLEPIDEPMSPLMGERSMALSLSVLCVPLDEVKQAAQRAGGSVNDVFVTAVTGGLRRYHEHFGASVDELQMMMPINLRSHDARAQQAGNQFAPARFVVPVGIEDPEERLEAIQERVRVQREEPALPYAEEIMGVLNQLPAAALNRLMESMLTSVDFVTSNVPGPRRPAYMGGARIEQMFPFGPPAGAGVNFTLFSYAGTCHVGVNADRAAVSEPELLLECLQKGFDEVLAIGV
jgi:diacylglycerol O-acyltransferase